MEDQRITLIQGKASGSPVFDITERQLIVALAWLGHVPERIDVLQTESPHGAPAARMVYVYPESPEIVEAKVALLTGKTDQMLVSIRAVWAAEKSWNMAYSLFRDKFLRSC